MRINKDIGFKFRILGLLKSETLGVGHGDLHSDKLPGEKHRWLALAVTCEAGSTVFSTKVTKAETGEPGSRVGSVQPGLSVKRVQEDTEPRVPL